jgi:hypothetical protein
MKSNAVSSAKPARAASARPAPAPAPEPKPSAPKKSSSTAAKAVSPAATPAAPRAAVPTASPAPAPEKPAKPPKVRLVRDSFTMPEADFALVATLKERALKKGRAAKKSELLRAGLQLLGQQSPAALVAALERLQPIKTGRPKRSD